jgi:hypothetical protein
MKTPEQSVVAFIMELREKGIAYNKLMAERDRAEAFDDDEDDDTVSVHRSTQSIDSEIDELLDDTMEITRQLVGIPESPADDEPANAGYTVIGHYDNGLRYVGHHSECESVSAAIQRVADVYPDETVCIVSVLAGEHKDLMEGDYVEDTEDWRNNAKETTQPDRDDIRPSDSDRVS